MSLLLRRSLLWVSTQSTYVISTVFCSYRKPHKLARLEKVMWISMMALRIIVQIFPSHLAELTLWSKTYYVSKTEIFWCGCSIVINFCRSILNKLVLHGSFILILHPISYPAQCALVSWAKRVHDTAGLQIHSGILRFVNKMIFKTSLDRMVFKISEILQLAGCLIKIEVSSQIKVRKNLNHSAVVF